MYLLLLILFIFRYRHHVLGGVEERADGEDVDHHINHGAEYGVVCHAEEKDGNGDDAHRPLCLDTADYAEADGAVVHHKVVLETAVEPKIVPNEQDALYHYNAIEGELQVIVRTDGIPQCENERKGEHEWLHHSLAYSLLKVRGVCPRDDGEHDVGSKHTGEGVSIAVPQAA